ncbi:hypothetical protein SAMN02745673_02761 [Marinactinospora thermotolerans DSM 45154]|uniref:Uncharacterized protein n=1 Tax=Marinactinospora thermotolerans DSM 45154 TaxID=1122192 RepID=A0A1T4RKS3_9ACTN|nr:hypothetical protein [Marinactinospora thermotolerans]SKA16386.1 hypothetical protein SAMN02745673_02761 [Marinactinospora thermotolerans DSM 45154]
MRSIKRAVIIGLISAPVALGITGTAAAESHPGAWGLPGRGHGGWGFPGWGHGGWGAGHGGWGFPGWGHGGWGWGHGGWGHGEWEEEEGYEVEVHEGSDHWGSWGDATVEGGFGPF